MGTVYLIEFMNSYTLYEYPQWWDGKSWTYDCHSALKFATIAEADAYMLDGDINNSCPDVEVVVTEHIFMSPISTQENLN